MNQGLDRLFSISCQFSEKTDFEKRSPCSEEDNFIAFPPLKVFYEVSYHNQIKPKKTESKAFKAPRFGLFFSLIALLRLFLIRSNRHRPR